MRKALILLICILTLSTVISADENGFKQAEKVELKVYYNLAHADILSYEGQVEFLDNAAKKNLPLNKWDVPTAVVTHKLYKDSSTVEIVFTASTMKVEESVDEKELIELAKYILDDWRLMIKTIADAKAKIAQDNLAKALEYQKKQESTKRKIDELKLKIKHTQDKLLEIEDLIDSSNDALSETKESVKKLNVKENEYKDRIQKLNLEIDKLPLYNPLSEEYMSKLAEKAMILNWKPEIIESLGDARKLK